MIITINISFKFIALVILPYNFSRFEPVIAPGLLSCGHESISVLLSNLYPHDIQIKWGQVLAFVHFVDKNDVDSVFSFGTFDDLNLPCSTLLSIILKDDIMCLFAD